MPVVGETMSENSGLKMRIIALDELMKCCVEIGRNSDNGDHKSMAKQMYEVAKVRKEFLSASRTEDDD
jgi:hypothetical protein